MSSLGEGLDSTGLNNRKAHRGIVWLETGREAQSVLMNTSSFGRKQETAFLQPSRRPKSFQCKKVVHYTGNTKRHFQPQGGIWLPNSVLSSTTLPESFYPAGAWAHTSPLLSQSNAFGSVGRQMEVSLVTENAEEQSQGAAG